MQILLDNVTLRILLDHMTFLPLVLLLQMPKEPVVKL